MNELEEKYEILKIFVAAMLEAAGGVVMLTKDEIQKSEHRQFKYEMVEDNVVLEFVAP